MNYHSSQNAAEILLDIKAVTLSPEKPFVYVSGIHSPIYTDNRLLMGYPKKRAEITGYIADVIKERGIQAETIAGTATAGIAPAAWIADRLLLPMIFVRKKLKGYGTGKLVEGIIQKGKNIVLIEDVISTGKSSLNAVDAIRNEGGTVDICIAFFEYGFNDTRDKFKEKNVTLYTLTTLDALVDVALKKGMLKEKDKALVLSWRKDPWKWTEEAKKRFPRAEKTEY